MELQDLTQLATFRKSIRQFLHFSEQLCETAGLTSQQYQALVLLRVHDGPAGMTITDLAQGLIVKHNSAVGLVDRLAKEGLLKRGGSGDDRRHVTLEFTERGEEVVSQLAAAHRDELQRVAPEFIARLTKVVEQNQTGLAD
jgi:DNA-binding MarR family transcriptional regulator